MFEEGKGAKGGKKDLILTKKNRQRKRKLSEQMSEEKTLAEKKEKQEKEKQLIANNSPKKEQRKEPPQRRKKAGIAPIPETKKKDKQVLQKEELTKAPSSPKTFDNQVSLENKEENLERKNINGINNAQKEPKKSKPVEIPKQKEEIKEQNINHEEKPKANNQRKKTKAGIPYKEDTESLENDFSEEKNTSTTVQESTLPQDENPLWELKVIQELENLIKENQYQLDKLFAEYYLLEKEVDEVQYSEDAKYLSQEIEKLLDQLEKIKRELEVLVDTIDLENIYQLHDDYLTCLVENYKQQVSREIIIDQVQDFKHDPEYLSIMKKIILFEQARDELEIEVKEKQNELELRDQDFEKLKTECLEIEKTTTLLQRLIDEANLALEEIQTKVAETVHVTENVKTRLKSSLSLMAQILLMMALLKKKPFKQSIGLMAIEGVLAINILRELLNPKEIKEVTLTSDIKDYQDEILSAINDVGSVTDLVEKSLVDIQEIHKNFEHDFSIYQDLPEYKELLTTIITMEEELAANKEKIIFVQKEMARELEKNDQKVKRYENLAAEQNEK